LLDSSISEGTPTRVFLGVFVSSGIRSGRPGIAAQRRRGR
jgi:hypothetical protein